MKAAGEPNVSSWGGSILYHNDSDPGSLFHLYVTEETGGKGLDNVDYDNTHRAYGRMPCVSFAPCQRRVYKLRGFHC